MKTFAIILGLPFTLIGFVLAWAYRAFRLGTSVESTLYHEGKL